MHSRYFSVAAAAAICVHLSVAQAAENVSVMGEIRTKNTDQTLGLVVELRSMEGSRASQRSFPSPSGEFQFTAVPKGMYTLQVGSMYGEPIHSETLTLHDPATRVSIQLDSGRKKSAGEGTSISVKRLAHKVPKAAKAEYKASFKAQKRGDVTAVIQHLKAAQEIDPEYVEAINNLGCQYMKANQPDLALEALRRAAAIDDKAPLVHRNIAMVHVSLKQWDRAAEAARKALEVDSSDVQARYIVGFSLYVQQVFTDETEASLRKVTETFPEANVYLAGTLAMRGGEKEARRVLERYVEGADEKHRVRAEALLMRLRN